MSSDNWVPAKGARARLYEWTPDQRESWMDDGACTETDPDAFFPDKGDSTAAAKSVCAGCTVVEQCLRYALETDTRFGVWGGLSSLERSRIRVAANKAQRGAEVAS